MCKHNKNFKITEVMSATHTRSGKDGVALDVGIGYNEIGDISHYEFKCECGKFVRFGAFSSKKPDYVNNALKVLYPEYI